MDFTFRKVITGIQLSAEEVKVLKEAENILIKADKELCDLTADTEVEADLMKLVGQLALELGRLNVKVTQNE